MSAAANNPPSGGWAAPSRRAGGEPRHKPGAAQCRLPPINRTVDRVTRRITRRRQITPRFIPECTRRLSVSATSSPPPQPSGLDAELLSKNMDQVRLTVGNSKLMHSRDLLAVGPAAAATALYASISQRGKGRSAAARRLRAAAGCSFDRYSHGVFSGDCSCQSGIRRPGDHSTLIPGH